jgi:hypothetical protein
MNKKTDRGEKAAELTGIRSALLAVSLRPFVLRLDSEDLFDGKPALTQFPNIIDIEITVPLLELVEIAIQYKVRRQWDKV